MRRLRILSRLLDRQLAHIYRGHWARAGSLFDRIEELCAALESDPPQGEPFQLERLRLQCLAKSDLATAHWQVQTAEMGDTVRILGLERAVRAVQDAPSGRERLAAAASGQNR